ncbi:Histone-lysine N-methyltransferase [Bertholletia excelsa]
MASSDEEGEIIPECVTNYHFVDHIERPISFSILPLQWSEDEVTKSLGTQIFLHGSADNGLWKIYKQVTAWKFELSYVLPEIYVLTKDKTWIKLQKPRKCYEHTIKTILVTVHCLHFVKMNPETSRTILWNHLVKVFSSYVVEPSEDDLLHHMPLINEAASRDKNIAKSEYLAAFCLMPGKRKALHEDNQIAKETKFIADGVDDGDGDESDEDQLFDSVCAICDNGGEILPCEGRCIRSFHATAKAGAESLCVSLGLTDVQVEAIQNFLCRNCQYQQHQCFICGRLGSSDKSSGTEVFPCVSATCGHFYHPDCVAKLLHPSDVTRAEKVRKKIAAGESFACPAHKCFICKQGEDKGVFELQFAMCRRCPKAYHRKCLPKEIAYEGDCDTKVFQRAWDGLLPNRILIYCLEHKIIPELRTPERNHLLFPSVDGKKKRLIIKLKLAKKELIKKKMTKVLPEIGSFHGNGTEKTIANIHKKVKCTVGEGSVKNFGERLLGQRSDSKVTGAMMESSRMIDSTVQERAWAPSAAHRSKASLGYDHGLLSMNSHATKPKQRLVPGGETKKIIAAMPMMKKASSKQPLIDEDMEKRIVTLMKQSTSSFDSEEFIKKQNVLSSMYSRSVVEKTLTMGKVEVAVQAVRAASKKLEEGCTIEDAKAVCGPEVLREIARWKKNLGVHLAPFLHGKRYTSFGRHFTKVDKLKGIVDRLCWYVQDGDMVVDFCCGSNDFSCLLKEKLEEMGKSCSFRNYDLIQAKNNFNFEKRDWMTVGVEDLPSGSQLIMGLNPPFGVHGTRANQFIDKALEFKPKLLILIVPRETKRLDQKKYPYDLIWEDDSMLAGKSFYLPGSVNVHDQQIEQWNLEPPPLYLWSRPDWTARHKTIARSHGHLPKEQEEACVEPWNAGKVISNYLMEENLDAFGDFSDIMSGYSDLSGILDDAPEDSDEMCVNRKLFTPTNSPNKNTKSSILFENRPQGDFSTCAVVNAARPGLSGQHSRYGTEHATFHSTVTNATGSDLEQTNEGALPAGQPNWSSYNGIGPNCYDQLPNYAKVSKESFESTF